MSFVGKVKSWLFPGVQMEDGREKWPSRTAFILASMGGAVGLGNVLRYPYVVWENNGLQWFIPYLLSLFVIGLPLLVLEISIGQAYRGGPTIALGRINHRARGIGLATVYTGYVICVYYVPILAWVMVYLRNSFINPLPWAEDNEAFFTDKVIANVDPTVLDDGSLVYEGTNVVWETFGWTVFTWALVYLSIFKGVSLTGRVVYFTMLIPILMIIIILIRAVTLDNAGRGIAYYMGVWHGEKLGSPQIWRAAAAQIFFSIGTGLGYFSTYSSYNSKFANAVQDSVIIAMANSTFEVVAGFATFAIIGNLDIQPGTKLGSFAIAFLTYPEAIAQMPVAANFWAVLFFLAIMFLGIDSAFALLETAVTVVTDTNWGKRLPRPVVVGLLTIASLLLSMMYTTEFGLALLDAVDTYATSLALIFAMWGEVVVSTCLYRYKDVVKQTGMPAWVMFNGSYVFAMVLSIVLAHTVSPAAGGGTFAGIWVVGFIAATFMSQSPPITGPWGSNDYVNRFWWLAFYSGNQLTRDLNAVVARGKNWSIPTMWAPLLKYITAPVLALIFSFSYPSFHELSQDPTQIFGFTIANLAERIKQWRGASNC